MLLGGDDIYSPGTRPADVRRQIGMVFQKPNPFPAMSIYDNVASGLKLAGIKVANKDALVEDSLRRAGLWNEVRRRLRHPAAPCPAASSSGCASPARWRSRPTCC